jgi:hypothetical protein
MVSISKPGGSEKALIWINPWVTALGGPLQLTVSRFQNREVFRQNRDGYSKSNLSVILLGEPAPKSVNHHGNYWDSLQ